MNPIIATLSVTAAVPTGIFNAIVGGAGALTLSGALVTGTVATMNIARRLAFVSDTVGDTSQTFAVTGTDRYGNSQAETVALNGTTTVSSKLDFKTVTKIVASALTVGTISIGTSSTASTAWFFPSREISPCSIRTALSVPVGTTASMEHTFDDPNVIDNTRGYPDGTVAPNSVYPPTVWPDLVLSGITGANVENAFTAPVFAFRMTVTAGTGTATMWAIQAGISG